MLFLASARASINNTCSRPIHAILFYLIPGCARRHFSAVFGCPGTGTRPGVLLSGEDSKRNFFSAFIPQCPDLFN